jgi:zinc finger HIT domain-containing protein 1
MPPPKNATKKRASTRTVVVSKHMRKVDVETRNEVRDKRLLLLEADNYIESEAVEGDDAYDNDGDNEQQKRKKAKVVAKGSGGLSLSKWASRKVKLLEKIVLEEGYDQGKVGDLFAMDASACIEQCGRYPNYLSINASQSTRPPRKFCSVCGHKGEYACTRCGMRYCSIKCNNHHKETRCMKFSLF